MDGPERRVATAARRRGPAYARHASGTGILRRIIGAVFLLALSACAATGRPPRVVLVAGATGQTGVEVVRELHERGIRVRALVRDPAAAQRQLGAGVQVVTGDVKDPTAVLAAMRGADAVISAVGARHKDGPDRPETVDYEGVRNLVDAARAARVRQFVLVSARGVTRRDDPLNRMFGNVLVWKLAGEDYLRASGLAYTVVRPAGLLNEPGGQGDVIFAQGDAVPTGVRTIARADVARVCVEALRYPQSRFRTFEIWTVAGSPVSDWQAKFAGLRPDPR